MDESLEQKFEEDPELRKAVNFILANASHRFSDIFQVRYAVVFTNSQSDHYAGKCHKLPDLYRYKTDFDYIIEIYKENFLNESKDNQLKILIHELHHVWVDENGKLRLRKHNEQEDFCELPSHDKYSELVLADLIQEFVASQKPKTQDSA